MAPVVAGAGLALLALGVLAIAVGLGLMVFTVDDPATNSEGEPIAADHGREAAVGQTIAVGGGAVAFLGLVFIVIGKAD